MNIEDLHKTIIQKEGNGEGYELTYICPEWGDQTFIGHAHFDSDNEQAKKGAALFRASFKLQKELRHLVRLIEPLEKNGGLNIPGLATLNGARAALALSENTKETAE